MKAAGRPFPQGGKEALPGALWGGGRAARGPLRCLLFWTPAPALSRERTHVCESGLSGSMGEAGKTGHVCASVWSAPPGEWETSRRCNLADAGAVTFPARAQLPLRCPRAEGAPRRAGPPGRAATTTAATRPGRGPAALISGDSRLLPCLMAPVTLPLSPPVSGALPRARRPNRSLRVSRQRSPGRDRLTAAAGRLPRSGAHGPGPTPTAGPP